MFFKRVNGKCQTNILKYYLKKAVFRRIIKKKCLENFFMRINGGNFQNNFIITLYNQTLTGMACFW